MTALSIYSLPTALTAVVMVVAAVVFTVRMRNYAASIRFAIVAGSIAFWMFAFTELYSATEAASALRWARLAYLTIPLIAPALYSFTVGILNIGKRRRVATVVVWGLGFVFCGIAFSTDWLVAGVHQYWWGFYPRYGPAGAAFITWFVGVMFATIAEYGFAFERTERRNDRLRIRALRLGLLIACVACVDFLPKFGIALYPFGYLAMLLFVVQLGRTIWKFDLVDITPSLAAREIIRTMADALIVCNADGVIRFVNHATEATFGFTEDDLVGRSVEKLVDPDSTLASSDRLKVALKRGILRDLHRVFRTKAGELVEVSLSISTLVERDRVAGVVIVARDMRERNRAEREIRNSMSLVRSTLESTADGIVVVDSEGRLVLYNQRFTDMWHVPRPILDDHRRVLDFALDQVRDPESFLAGFTGADPGSETFTLVELKDGRTFERYSVPRRLEGTPGGRVWSFRDITSRRTAEDALRASEQRYRLLFERNSAGVYRANLDGRILDCNDAFARIFGFAAREQLLESGSAEIFFNRNEREALFELLQQVKNVTSLELCLRRKDGSRIWVLGNVTLLENEAEPLIEGTFVDITDRKIAEEQIEYHAYHDVLTCLPNRKLFTDRLTLALAHARRTHNPLAVMFLDLDHFKVINDTLGHTSGDELLLQMADRLKDSIREGDTVARLGGDEFTLLITDLQDPGDAALIAQKILETIEAPVMIGTRQLYVTGSIGIALYPEDGSNPEHLLQNADNALYRAKEAGRNNYQLCTPEMKVRAVERLSLESSLRRAIECEEFILHYQPQVNLANGTMSGVEALIRWRDPERGVMLPASFIPLAEDSRLIVPIGEWVLRTACQQAKIWETAGLTVNRMAVNLSARQFQQPDLIAVVRRVLHDAALSPELLEFEITESTAMQNAELTIAVLRELREMGIAISIDDFGTGYSSLNYLKRFPINTVKIDQGFIRDITTNPGDAAIVNAVIGIGRSLNLRVVAEGVETEAQLEFLRDRRCDEMQGFFFSRPIPAEELTQKLVTGTNWPS